MGMLPIGEKFDFKQRTFLRGSHQNTKVLISQSCLVVVSAFFLWGQTAFLSEKILKLNGHPEYFGVYYLMKPSVALQNGSF